MNINEPRHGGGFVLPFFNTGKKHRTPHSGRASLKSNRIPGLNWIPDTVSYLAAPIHKFERYLNSRPKIRNHFVATSAEFTGTTLFLFFAFSGTQVALLATPTNNSNVVGTPSDPSQLLYIALCFGFSLAVNAWVFFRISGGLFNPAVTLGMCLVGALPYIRGMFLFVAQILGGITAAALASALFPGPITFRTNLGGGTSIVRGLFIEMFLTAELVFTIFMLAAEKHKGTFIAPIGIGLALFIAELTGVYFTGGSLNPARSFGPAVVSHSFHGYHWIYWIGPFLGAILASGFYKFIKMLEYETANPGQDSDRVGEDFDPELHRMSQSHDNRVSFDSTAMGAISKDLNDAERRHPHHHIDGTAAAPITNGVPNRGNIGTPQEFGAERRPYMDSPAPPHPNDQFTGLNEGGMHANEHHATTSATSDSGNTLVDNGGPNSPVKKSAMRNSGITAGGNRGSGLMGGSLRDNTYNNQRIGEHVGSEEFYDK